MIVWHKTLLLSKHFRKCYISYFSFWRFIVHISILKALRGPAESTGGGEVNLTWHFSRNLFPIKLMHIQRQKHCSKLLGVRTKLCPSLYLFWQTCSWDTCRYLINIFWMNALTKGKKKLIRQDLFPQAAKNGSDRCINNYIVVGKWNVV